MGPCASRSTAASFGDVHVEGLFAAADGGRERAGGPSPHPRLIMVSPRYHPFTGGLETHVHEVATRLAARGWTVTVVTADEGGELPPAERREDVEIRRAPAWRHLGDVQCSPRLPALLAAAGGDVVHVQGIHTLVPVLALRALRRGPLPYLVSFHTGGHSSAIRNAIRPLQWGALRGPLTAAAGLVAVSEFEAGLFARSLHLPRSRFSVVPNGFELPPLTAPPAGGPPVLVSLGRLERYKGHHRAIGAMATVWAARPDAELQIVGGGPDERRLRRLAARSPRPDQIRFRNFPPDRRRQLAELIASSSLVVLLSEYEAHPVAVMEAVGLGRRVLVADNTGLAEIAGRGLARAIPLRRGDAEIGAAMLEELRRPPVSPAPRLPDWDVCTDRLAALYRRIAGRATA